MSNATLLFNAPDRKQERLLVFEFLLKRGQLFLDAQEKTHSHTLKIGFSRLNITNKHSPETLHTRPLSPCQQLKRLDISFNYIW